MKKCIFLILTFTIIILFTSCKEQNEATFEDFLVPIDHDDEIIVDKSEIESDIIISDDVISIPEVVSKMEAVSSVSEAEQFVPAAIVFPDTDTVADPEAETTTQITPTLTDNTYMVWKSKSGSKYHSYSSCSNMKSATQITKEEAIALGLDACKKCH